MLRPRAGASPARGVGIRQVLPQVRQHRRRFRNLVSIPPDLDSYTL